MEGVRILVREGGDVNERMKKERVCWTMLGKRSKEKAQPPRKNSILTYFIHKNKKRTKGHILLVPSH